MANERIEGTMEGNTKEETNKTVSAPKGGDTVKVIGKMKRKEMQKLRDAKKEVMVEDSAPTNQTLEEHDRRHHPDGYKEGDTCKFRENIKTETETDQADVISPNNPPQTQNQEQAEESREKGEEESEAEKPLKLRVPTEEEKDTNSEEVEEVEAVEEETKLPQEEENSEKGIEVAGEESDLTPEDKEYIEAIKNGDMDKAEQMVREAARAAGYTISAYHGTNTGKFTVFDKDRANPEGDMGAGFYLTSNEDDVSRNYEGGGPDWDNKVAMLAERLQYEEDIDDYEEAKKVAEERLKGENGGSHLIEAYVKMENPAYVDSTMLMEDIGEDLNIDDYVSEDDYFEAKEQAVSETLESVVEAVNDLGFTGTDAVGGILYEAAYNGGITIPDLKEAMNDVYAEDEEGRLVNNEVIRTIVEALGYDGIIDSTVSEKFKKMDLDYDTTHYIAFSPNQIKSSEAITKDDDGKIIPLSKRFNNQEYDIRYSKSIDPKEEGTDKGFGEEFWGSREGKRIKGYARKYGAAIDEEKQSAQNGYAANFNESGKYKMPLSDGKFSKDFLKRVRGEDVWDKKDREEAEAAGKLLNNILGNVTIEFSDKPYDGGNSDSRKSILVDEKTDAEYLDAVNKGDMETAQRMVREAAAKAMPDTKVLDKDGLPLVVYHGGTFGFNKNTIANGLVHFGTLQAAADRFTDIGQLGAVEREDGWHLTDSFDNTESKEVYPSREAAMMSRLKDSVKGYFLNIRNPAQTEDRISDPEFDEENGIDSLIAQEKHEGYDGNIYMNNVEDAGSTSWVAYSPNQIKSADAVTYDDKGNVIPLSQRFKMDNPDIRYMTSQGKVVGEYDRKNGKITLYPGAKVKDVVHEYAHGLWQFAEQEAKEGRTTLRDKFHKIAKAAPTAVKKAVGEAYKLQGSSVIMEECFTHELARKSEQNQEFAKAIKTASGKSWYKRAWRTIKDTWGGIARKMGYGKADIDKMENMNTHESAEYILKQMAQGKHFGDIDPTPEGGGKRKSISGIYTGSAADYDKPSLLKVGTGHGASIYGYGLYGSNKREVAEGYAEMEVGKYEYSYQKNGKIINEREDTIESKVVGALKLWGDVETAIEELKGVPNSEDLIKELKEHGSEYKEYNPQNHIYQQTFFTNREKGDESHLIDWNNNVSEENKKRVAKGLAKKFIKALKEIGQYTPQRGKELEESEYNKIGNVTGRQLYLQMVGLLGSEKKASEFLADCDIDGIKYKADSHNEDGKGWNYVSFRDDNIKVDRKWKDGEEVEVNKENK